MRGRKRKKEEEETHGDLLSGEVTQAHIDVIAPPLFAYAYHVFKSLQLLQATSASLLWP